VKFEDLNPRHLIVAIAALSLLALILLIHSCSAPSNVGRGPVTAFDQPAYQAQAQQQPQYQEAAQQAQQAPVVYAQPAQAPVVVQGGSGHSGMSDMITGALVGHAVTNMMNGRQSPAPAAPHYAPPPPRPIINRTVVNHVYQAPRPIPAAAPRPSPAPTFRPGSFSRRK
jgi:hypothetical protein